MLNLLRNCRNLVRLCAAGERVYSLPAYALGLVLARSNCGPGPVAWLRGWPGPRIDAREGSVELGHVALYPGVKLQCLRGGRISVGDGSFVNHHTRVRSRSEVRIGRQCMVSWEVLITDFAGFSDGERCAPVRIGDNCWIGAKALILGGTILGDGCVVAAGAVVQGEFPAGKVIAGEPSEVSAQRVVAAFPDQSQR